MPERDPLRALHLATFVACGAVCAWTMRQSGVHADDAWMFVRYADHWLESGVMAWNPGGPATFGITSLSHLAGVTLLRAVGLAPESALQLAVLLPALALIAAWLHACRGIESERLDLQLLGCAIPIYLVATATFRIHLTSGMDTMLGLLAGFLLVRTAVASMEVLSRANALAFCASSLLAAATRPEMSLLVAGCVLALGVRYREEPRLLATRLLAPLAAAVLMVLVGLWLHFGTVIPYTFYAKSAGHYVDLADFYARAPLEQLRIVTRSAFPLIASVLLFSPSRRTLGFVLPGFALFIAYCFQIVWVMGYEGRFYMPLLGGLLALTVEGLREEGRRPEASRNTGQSLLAAAALGSALWLAAGPRALWGAGAAIAVAIAFQRRVPGHRLTTASVLVLTLALAASVQLPREGKPPLATAQPFMVELSDGLASFDGSVRLASTEHGYLGARNPATAIVDLAGLHDERLARRFDVDVLFERDPDLIIMPRRVYRGMVREIEQDPRFQSDYHYLSRTHPQVKTVCDREKIGIAIRIDRPVSADLTRAVIDAAWAADPQAARGRPDASADAPLLGQAGGH